MISRYPFFYNFKKKRVSIRCVIKSTYLEKNRKKKKKKRGNKRHLPKTCCVLLYTIRKMVWFGGVAWLAIGKIAALDPPPQFAWKVTCRLQFSRFLCAINVLDAAPCRCRCRVRSFVRSPAAPILPACAHRIPSIVRVRVFRLRIPLSYIISKIRVLHYR